MAERMTFQPGDFFEAVTCGGGGYVLRHILHDWSDDECVQILSRYRSAMSDNMKLLVMEEVIPNGKAPDAKHRGTSRDAISRLSLGRKPQPGN